MSGQFSIALAALLLLAAVSPAQNPNLLLNPGFESGTTSWTFYTNGAGSFSSAVPGFSGSRCGRIAIDSAGSNMQLYQSALPLDPATSYTLSFAAYSSTGRDLSVSVLKQASPFTNYGLSNHVFNLTTGWQTLTVEFITAGFSAPVADGRLRFWFASYAIPGETYFLDAVDLRKTVTPPAPAAITLEPVNRIVTAGQSATFEVSASGWPTPAYRWQSNGSDIPGATASSWVTPPAVPADSGTGFRCIVTNESGADTSRTAFLVVSQPLSISIWHGRNQTFGTRGNPVPAINILGNIFSAQGIAALSYTLNGGAPVALSLGPDTRRLRDAGDFNIDIPCSVLVNGVNRVAVTVRDSVNSILSDTVQCTYAAGNRWPLPYTIDWSTAGQTWNVAQVLDGLWSVDAAGGVLRPIQIGYDRLVAIGEQTWRDYEITVPITMHGIDSSGFAYPSNGAGIGVLMRWPGHSDLPASLAGRQPKTGYLPYGAIIWNNYDAEGEHLMIMGNNLQRLSRENPGRHLQPGTRYIFKARVETVEGIGGRYSVKVWQDGFPEPEPWDLTGQEELTDPQQGCVLLIAHHVDASFGNVSVLPLGRGPYDLSTTAAGSGTIVRSPEQPAYYGGDVVSLRAIPAPGWRFQSWSGALTGTTNPATVTIDGNTTITATFTPLPLPAYPAADEFNATTLDTGLWTFINPLSDATLSMTGSQLSVAIPAGTPHDIGTGGIFAPRIVQPVRNADFEVELRCQSSLANGIQMQGVIVEQDSTNFIRFDILRDSSGTRVFAASYSDGIPTVRNDTGIAGSGPFHLRVCRTGSLWMQRFSTNGIDWSGTAPFSHPLTVRLIEPFFGTAGNPSPAFTGILDYFRSFAASAGLDSALARPEHGDGAQIGPAEFSLSQNYPNPFNGRTLIRYAVRRSSVPARVSLKVFDLLGREVAVLVEEVREPGDHYASFNADRLPGGVYFYRLRIAESGGATFSDTGKMLLLR